MRMKTLSVAIVLATLPATSLFAGALDRSGQSISPFFQKGNYAEAGFKVLDPTVDGRDSSGNGTGDMANTYRFPAFALKLQPFEQVSFGLFFDEPFGADASYSGNSNFVAKPTDRVLGSLPVTTGQLGTRIDGGTRVNVQSRDYTAIIGYQPTVNFNIYGGVVYQEVKGKIDLRGSAYSLFNGYSANIKRNNAYGWLAGVAFEKPEIALRAAITYRSEIDHEVQADESVPLVNTIQKLPAAQLGGILALVPAQQRAAVAGALGKARAINTSGTGDTKITTPQSVNLDLQTGIMADTVAFANVRWVNWKSFSIRPNLFGQVAGAVSPILGKGGYTGGFNLVDYSKDQWSADVGLGRKFNDQFAGTASVGWDSGTGNPVTTLGPTEGYWNVGLGLRYNPVKDWDVSVGAKYFWLGDAKAETGAHSVPGNEQASYAGDFKDGHAIAYGLKVGYHF